MSVVGGNVRRYRWTWYLLILCLTLGLALGVTGIPASSIHCSHAQVVVQAADPEVVAIVCRGAGDAIEFLSGVGLETGADAV